MYRVALMALCIVVNVSWASRPKQISNAPFRTLFLPAQVNQIARSADGKLLAVATHNGLYLCQTSVETKPQLLIEGHLKSTTFNSAGTLLAAGGRDDFGRGKVYIMELETGEFVELIGHTKTIYSVCFSPDGRILASGSDSVRLWDIEQQKEIGSLPLETHVA